MKLNMCFLVGFICSTFLFIQCSKDSTDLNWKESSYSGSYQNISFTESLIKEFTPGIYYEKDIPADISTLEFGRIEIDFRYDGNALNYFSPLFYYGSINKNDNDNTVEMPKFHLAVEIGHYNVIPLPVEYLFYTICTNNYPQYCRDTDFPIIPGIDYTVIIDKRPEGMVLQMKKEGKIVNVFTHAFFPDSAQMFFKDVTGYTNANKGDSLQKVLMVGKGFAGIEPGLHNLNGAVNKLRIYKYSVTQTATDYELKSVRNQHTENQRITYSLKDKSSGNDSYVQLKYEFLPHKFAEGDLIPNGEMQMGQSEIVLNNQSQSYVLRSKNIGLYKLYPQTLDSKGIILKTSMQPFEVWVYPKEWDFEY